MRDMFARFLRDRRGGVAPMFAIAIIPVIGLTGAAIDYSRANSVRTGMQAAIDATALAMARLAPTLTQSELQQKTTEYFNAMFNHPEAKNLVLTPTYTTSGGAQLTIAISGAVDTTFMKIMGHNSINLGSTSTVKWGMNRLRVALALDNTGSMADAGKMTALKTATNSLLTQLKDAATTNGDVYVSIVPFNKNVNAGSSNYNQSWVDFIDHPSYVGWDKQNGTCSHSNFPTYDECIDKKKTWTPNNHSTWNGCVTDRDKPYDVEGSAPTSSSTTKFPAEQYDDCPRPVMGLSYNWSGMTNLVNAMTPAGTTNQTIGLVWAWMSLTGGGPFTVPAMDPNYQYQKIIILMSDGLNTQNRWDGVGWSQSSAVDSRMALACTNAKNAGLTIYTIHVNTDGDPTSTILRDCATDTAKFYTVTSSSQLANVFTTIGTNLSKLRIAK
jgi:Flp pilus assembly protein TadG